MRRQEYSDASYDMVLGYALFALIASRENGLLSDERPTLSRGEEKTARKFGKTWVTKAPPSFYTIQIGPEARAHLAKQTARLAAEKGAGPLPRSSRIL